MSANYAKIFEDWDLFDLNRNLEGFLDERIELVKKQLAAINDMRLWPSRRVIDVLDSFEDESIFYSSNAGRFLWRNAQLKLVIEQANDSIAHYSEKIEEAVDVIYDIMYKLKQDVEDIQHQENIKRDN